MLDLGEANLITVGSSVQETAPGTVSIAFRACHLIPQTPGRGPGCCYPHSADMDPEAERLGTLPRLSHPAVRYGLM